MRPRPPGALGGYPRFDCPAPPLAGPGQVAPGGAGLGDGADPVPTGIPAEGANGAPPVRGRDRPRAAASRSTAGGVSRPARPVR